MKTVFSLVTFALLASTSAFAADYASCKANLNKSAAEYVAYMAKSSQACRDEMNKGGETRTQAGVIAACGATSPFTLLPMKSRSAAACEPCRAVDAKLAAACGDNGAQTFIDRAKAL